MAMKLPMSHTISWILRRYSEPLSNLCAPCAFGSPFYIIAYSLLGMGLSGSDISSVISKDCFICSSLDPQNIAKICWNVKHGMKLVSSGIYFLLYTCILLGICYRQPVFLMPYFFIEGINIIILILYLILTLTLGRKFISYRTPFLLCFMVCNWLQIFCEFRRMVTTEL